MWLGSYCTLAGALHGWCKRDCRRRRKQLPAQGGGVSAAEGLADRITFREGNAEALAPPDNSVEVSLSFTVMEEVDADRMLHEMIRVTKPGGRIGVVVRAVDMQFWTNLALRPELLVKIKSAPMLARRTMAAPMRASTNASGRPACMT
jgi:SAM-dependent methyltransferase